MPKGMHGTKRAGVHARAVCTHAEVPRHGGAEGGEVSRGREGGSKVRAGRRGENAAQRGEPRNALAMGENRSARVATRMVGGRKIKVKAKNKTKPYIYMGKRSPAHGQREKVNALEERKQVSSSNELA